MNKKGLVIGHDPGLGKGIELFLKPLAASGLSAFSGTDGLKKAYAIIQIRQISRQKAARNLI